MVLPISVFRRPPSSPRFPGSLALGALALLGGAAGCGGPPPPAFTPPPTGVVLADVQRASIKDTTEYVATLKSRRSVSVQPQIDGYIARIAVKSGDVVKRGTLLIQIDPSRQLHTVASQRATAESRAAALAYAQQAARRVAALFDGGAASQQDQDQAVSAQATAQADLNALGAQVRESEVQLKYFSITAPQDGVVGDIPVREGDYVTPQSRLTTIDQNEQLELYLSVPVERASALRLGMPVQIVDNDDHILADSTISFISAEVDPDTQSVLVKTAIENLTHSLRTAQFARARVVWNVHDGAAVPSSAIKRLNGQTFAFNATEHEGKLVAAQVPVELGPIDGDSYPVLKGLKVGDKVVVSGLQKLGDGSPIAALASSPDAGPSTALK